MVALLANGLGHSLGSEVGTASPLHVGGLVYYVNSATGDSGYSGLSAEKPLDTLANGVSAASAGDIVVLMDGHTETITSAVTVNKAIAIVGEGQSSGQPAVVLTNNQAAGAVLTLSTAYAEVYNIWIAKQSQACSAVAVAISAQAVHLEDVYFEGDENSDAALCQINGSGTDSSLRNCAFVSDATDNTDVPTIALELSAAVTGIRMDGVVFDGGSYGFSDYALKASAGAITNLRARSLSFLRGADYTIHASSTGYVNPATVSGQHTGVW